LALLRKIPKKMTRNPVHISQYGIPVQKRLQALSFESKIQHHRAAQPGHIGGLRFFFET